MSVNHVTFLVLGVSVHGREFTEEQKESLDPPTRKKKEKFTFDQPALIRDCMAGGYTILGFIYKQTDQNESFYDVVEIPLLSDDKFRERSLKLKEILGLSYEPTLKWMVIPHYY